MPDIGTFANMRKATISFVLSVCPSVRMEHLNLNGRIYMIADIYIFRKYILIINFLKIHTRMNVVNMKTNIGF
jgi:hypothetical protein